MKRVTIAVDSEVDLKFRKKASQKYQFEKGWYSSAVADAMESWAEDGENTIIYHSTIMDFINPDLWEQLKLDLNLDEENPFESMESIMSKFNDDNDHQLKIERKNNNILIKLENKEKLDLESNLKSLIILQLILRVIISSLEETTNEKFEIVGIGEMPPIYLKKR